MLQSFWWFFGLWMVAVGLILRNVPGRNEFQIEWKQYGACPSCSGTSVVVSIKQVRTTAVRSTGESKKEVGIMPYSHFHDWSFHTHHRRPKGGRHYNHIRRRQRPWWVTVWVVTIGVFVGTGATLATKPKPR